MPTAEERLRLLRPDGSTAFERRGSAAVGRYTALERRPELDLDVLGTWRLVYELGGRTLVDAPFDVVASAADVVNRAPLLVTAALVPAAPRADEVVSCRIGTSLVREDPEYDIVSYRYRWTVDGRVVRESRNAAL